MEGEEKKIGKLLGFREARVEHENMREKKMFVELKSGKMERGERNCRKGQMDAARFE